MNRGSESLPLKNGKIRRLHSEEDAMKSAATIQKVGPLVFFLAVTAFSLVFVLTGCDNGPLSIDQLEQQEETSFFDRPYNPAAMAKVVDDYEVESIVLYENFITVEDGGVVILGTTESAELRDTDGGSDAVTSDDVFVVQPFSFLYDTSFTLLVTKIVSSDGSEMPIIFDCSPDGLVFTSPAILLVNVWENFGKKASGINVYWHNEETYEWEFQGYVAADEVTGQAPILINHFSKYGIDGTPTSGAGGSKGDDPTKPGDGGGVVF